MPVLLRITGASIAELELELANLKAQIRGAVGKTAPAVTNSLRQHLQQLKSQSSSTTGQTWKMVHEIAAHLPGQFKLSDVRRQLNVPAGNIKAWRRNVGRWSKRTAVVIFEHVAGTHHPTVFTMPDTVRQEVVALGP